MAQTSQILVSLPRDSVYSLKPVVSSIDGDAAASDANKSMSSQAWGQLRVPLWCKSSTSKQCLGFYSSIFTPLMPELTVLKQVRQCFFFSNYRQFFWILDNIISNIFYIPPVSHSRPLSN